MKRNIIRNIFSRFTVFHPPLDCVARLLLQSQICSINITFCLISIASVSQVPHHCPPPCPIWSPPDQSCLEGLGIPGFLPLSGELSEVLLLQSWDMLTAALAQRGTRAGWPVTLGSSESPHLLRKAPCLLMRLSFLAWSLSHSSIFYESHSRESQWYAT